MDYLQPNTHCSGLPPSLHTWSMQAHIQSICIHNDPRLTGRGLWHQDAHSAPDITPHWLPWHQALTLSLSPGSESIFRRPCVCDTLRNTNIARNEPCSLAGLNILSCLDQILPLDYVTATQILSQNMSNVQIPSRFLAYTYFQKSPSLLLTCPKPRSKDGCLTLLYYPLSPDHSMFIQA